MARFTSPLKVSPLPNGMSWALLDSLSYEVGYPRSPDVVTVPEGFVTDFASVPRLLWVLFPRQGYYTNAAVIHDWLYWSKTRTRKEADRIFLEAMKVSWTLVTTRYLMYAAVRLFGWLAWWLNEKDTEHGVNRILKELPLATDPVPPRGLDRLLRSWMKESWMVFIA